MSVLWYKLYWLNIFDFNKIKNIIGLISLGIIVDIMSAKRNLCAILHRYQYVAETFFSHILVYILPRTSQDFFDITDTWNCEAMAWVHYIDQI